MNIRCTTGGAILPREEDFLTASWAMTIGGVYAAYTDPQSWDCRVHKDNIEVREQGFIQVYSRP